MITVATRPMKSTLKFRLFSEAIIVVVVVVMVVLVLVLVLVVVVVVVVVWEGKKGREYREMMDRYGYTTLTIRICLLLMPKAC